MQKTIKFYKIQSDETVAKAVFNAISNRLQQRQKVLWLVSGGSSAKIAMAVFNLLKKNNLAGLTIGLADERYGDVDHNDSNWKLLKAGGFISTGPIYMPILSGKDIGPTAKEYDEFLSKAFAETEYKIALLGIGADGHTAGILPKSSAVTSTKLVDYYTGPDFQRITITPKAIAILDTAIVYASGSSKLSALNSLSQEIGISEQPAQAIKLAGSAAVYSNLIGENI